MKIGFDNQKYLTMQSEHIKEITAPENHIRLYLIFLFRFLQFSFYYFVGLAADGSALK